MDRFFILLTLFSIPSLITVPYFDGLSEDFSNLIIEVTSGGEVFYPPYQIVQHEPSQWAEVNVTLPEEDYTISFLASFQGEAPAPRNPENAMLPENLPQDAFNISEQNGSIITFYFNLTEGNLSEQLNDTQNLSVLYTFSFNFTQNGTGNETSNETLNFMQEEQPNASQNGTNESNGAIGLPESPSNLTQNVSTNLTEYPGIASIEQLNPTNYTLNVSWNPSLAPDFSNLLVQFVSTGGDIANIQHGILKVSLSEWALLLFERPPIEGETVSLIALDYPAANGTNQSNLPEQAASPALLQNSLPGLVPELVDGLGRGTLNGSIYSFSQPGAGNDRQFVVMKDSHLYDVGAGDFSLSAWIRSGGDQTGTIIKWGNYEEGKFYNLQLSSGGAIQFSLGDVDSSVELETPDSINDSNWRHVAAIRQGGMLRIFVDGIQRASAQERIFNLSGNGTFSIGADMSYYAWMDLPYTQFWGDISNPQVWDRALGDEEIASLSKEGKSP